MSLRAAMSVDVGDLRLRLDLEVPSGGVTALVGPNGAGKSTALRVLCGLQPLDEGTVELDGQVLDQPSSSTFVEPEHRRVGVLFQDHLLFEHMSALENVAFGPRSRGSNRHDARAAALQQLERFGIGDLASRRPAALSGGQSQRVALARALVTGPELLLLDEPLAALDAAARAEVRRDLRRHVSTFDGPVVLVTHDPVDALALADDIVILEHGEVTQRGPVASVSEQPRTDYVAALFGLNLLRGVASGDEVRVGAATLVVAGSHSGEVLVVIRPSSISLGTQRPATSARTTWQMRLVAMETRGDRVAVRLDGPVPLNAEVTHRAVAELGLVEGAPVWASIKATDVQVSPI